MSSDPDGEFGDPPPTDSVARISRIFADSGILTQAWHNAILGMAPYAQIRRNLAAFAGLERNLAAFRALAEGPALRVAEAQKTFVPALRSIELMRANMLPGVSMLSAGVAAQLPTLQFGASLAAAVSPSIPRAFLTGAATLPAPAWGRLVSPSFPDTLSALGAVDATTLDQTPSASPEDVAAVTVDLEQSGFVDRFWDLMQRHQVGARANVAGQLLVVIMVLGAVSWWVNVDPAERVPQAGVYLLCLDLAARAWSNLSKKWPTE